MPLLGDSLVLYMLFTYHTATAWPRLRWMSLSWAMKMAATASYKAVPSMLIVAPTGITNLVTLGSTPKPSMVWIVIGIVAELKHR